jgi:hypothetical protein
MFGGIDMITNNLESQAPEIIDLFPQTKKEERKDSDRQKQRSLKRKLNQVILGKRSYLHVHSAALQTHFWFINEGLADPADKMFNGNVITMEMLAEILVREQPLIQTVEEMFGDKI